MLFSLERGLDTLKELIQQTPASYQKERDLQEFLVYEARLREILHKERLYGVSTPDMQVDRSIVISHLNVLAPRYPQAGKPVTSFNDLCH